MKALHGLESFATTINDLDDGLPKGRGRCFDIGIWGGCGVNCPAFLDGECDEPQEITKEEIEEEHGIDDALIIYYKYNCYGKKSEN